MSAPNQSNQTGKDEQLVSLYRYFIWSFSIFKAFRDIAAPPSGSSAFHQFSEMHMRAVYPYCSLYVVIEGWNELKQKKGIQDRRIDSLLADQNFLNSLRLLRNAVFHYQPELFHGKLMDFITKNDDLTVYLKIDQLLHCFELYFRSQRHLLVGYEELDCKSVFIAPLPR